ncbi:hypothetical protein ZWY2020_002846 [Hordeum vulgare]|nr:hypothetical protein ZWY2020_002846 [Hordeum vulgare]
MTPTTPNGMRTPFQDISNSQSLDPKEVKRKRDRERYAQNRDEINKRRLMATRQSAVTQLVDITCAPGAVPNSRELLDENENIYGGDESDWLHRNDEYQMQRKNLIETADVDHDEEARIFVERGWSWDSQ